MIKTKKWFRTGFWLLLMILHWPVFIMADTWDQPKGLYSVKSKVRVRKSASLTSSIICKIRHGRWHPVIKRRGNWAQIRLPDGRMGWVHQSNLSDIWLMVLKKERQILVKKQYQTIAVYPIALGFNPKGDKKRLGDGCTPEGRFYICEVNRKPAPFHTYGHTSLRISYPNQEDARRGLHKRMITKTQYRSIVRSINRGMIPLQTTKLGGSIKIHGGDAGNTSDWTLGCIALSNRDLTKLVSHIHPELTIVEIYKNKKRAKEINRSGIQNIGTERRGQQLIKDGCHYTRHATTIIPMAYPMGDFDNKQGVCTDLVIRSLRGIGIDLQVLLYEDILVNPTRYRISKANTNIDHRRTRNLKRYFDAHALSLSLKTPKEKPLSWRAGDIVIMDTGVQNGTIYDHIGIVSRNKDHKGTPLVINLWAIGSQLNEMELLNGDYPKIVGHYRLFHPFYYQASPVSIQVN